MSLITADQRLLILNGIAAQRDAQFDPFPWSSSRPPGMARSGYSPKWAPEDSDGLFGLKTIHDGSRELPISVPAVSKASLDRMASVSFPMRLPRRQDPVRVYRGRPLSRLSTPAISAIGRREHPAALYIRHISVRHSGSIQTSQQDGGRILTECP
jgi:hypothetical protein